MTTPNRSLSRRESIALGGTSLMALASCQKDPDLKDQKIAELERRLQAQVDQASTTANKEAEAKAMKAERDRVDGMLKQMNELVSARLEAAQKAVDAKAAAEKAAREAYEAKLLRHIQDLAAKVPSSELTEEQKNQIVADAQPFMPPARTPEEIEEDRKREEEKEREQLQAMMALLAIFSPILAAVLGFLAAQSEGMSDEESEEFADHLATGKELSEGTKEKVAKSRALSAMDAHITRTRQQEGAPQPRPVTQDDKDWTKKIIVPPVAPPVPPPTPTPVPPPGSSSK